MADVSDSDPIVGDLDLVPERKLKLQKAFKELQTRKNLVGGVALSWKDLAGHFADLEKQVRRRFDELVAKEKAFELKCKETQESLNKREQEIAQREQESLARVQEQKDFALAVIDEEKQKWKEEGERGIEVMIKKEKSRGSEDLNEAAIPEEADLDLNSKDADHLATSDKASEEKPVSEEATGIEKESSVDIPAIKPLLSDVKVRPQLKAFCENMDGNGLRKYIVDHRKDATQLRLEVPCALQSAKDPSTLVLHALECYHSPQHVGNAKRETEASATRRACILLLESLQVLLTETQWGADHPDFPSNIKDAAKEIADKWRSKMDVQRDTAGGNSLDEQAFLQLLATFEIASQYDEDELCQLVSAVARRKQTPALCKSLGLSAKMPGLVDKLIKEGKQVEALAFAHAFGFLEKIGPVELLKTYLKEARKTSQDILKSGNYSAAAQNDSMMKELSALKSVLKCIEDYKLGSQYPSDPLERRVLQLEKAKSDRKRAAGTVRGQIKRSKPSGGHAGSPLSERGGYYRSNDRSSYGGSGINTYGYNAAAAYDRPSQAGYAANAYAGGIPLSNSYLYSAGEGLGSSLYGAGGYSTSSAYSSYLRGGLPPPPPAYQSSFLH